MVHVQVSNEYINCALMYTTDHICNALPIKNLGNQDDKPTTPHELENGTRPLVSNLRVFSVHVLYKRQIHMLTQRR